MKLYMVFGFVIFALFSGTALATSENEPLGKIWREINELKQQVNDQKVETYIQSANRYFPLGENVSSLELLCNEGDVAIGGGLNGDIENLDYLFTQGESPVINTEGKAIGWRFTARHGGGNDIPVEIHVVCLKS